MSNNFQVGIVGAGLAGLSLAIQLGKAGISVVLFEKSQFPFHKLCGEYLSRESLPFLRSLGLDIDSLMPAQIDRLQITNASGRKLETDLPLGGIGISRWKMDFELYKLAKSSGAIVLENTLVQSSEYVDDKHIVTTKKGVYVCAFLISSFGKMSNLSKLNKTLENKDNHYIGIKYHVKYPHHPENIIGIHNFKDGYCGVCRLEKDWVSVCYLSHTDNLKLSNNNIQQMEAEVLFKNKQIREVFENAEFINERPISVSNIDFKRKNLVQDHVLYVGDAAGLITPLCGNGMSMALHGSSILGKTLISTISNGSSEKQLFRAYEREWRKMFATRMAVGRFIQKLFRKEKNADRSIALLNKVPFFNKSILRLTHGKEFT